MGDIAKRRNGIPTSLRIAFHYMEAEAATILRVSAYWTNVQRALCMSVVIFAFDDPGGYKNTTSCFLIGARRVNQPRSHAQSSIRCSHPSGAAAPPKTSRA